MRNKEGSIAFRQPPVVAKVESQMEKEVSALVARIGAKDSCLGMEIAKKEILKILDSVPPKGNYEEAFERLALLFKRCEPAAHVVLSDRELAFMAIDGHGKGVLTRIAILSSEFAMENVLPLYDVAFLEDSECVSNVATAVRYSPEIAAMMLKDKKGRLGQYLMCEGAIFTGHVVPKTEGVTIRDEIMAEHPEVWFRYHPVSYSIVHPIKAFRLARRP